MKTFLKGFVYAGRGIWFCIRYERNFRIHLIMAAYVLSFATHFSLTRTEWAVLFLTIASVIAAEAINTAVEQTIDLLSPGSHPMARAAKDAAAGAVLVCAFLSVCIGIALFWVPSTLAALWVSITGTLWRGLLFILSLVLSLCFIIFGGEKKSVSYKNRK